MAFDGSGNLCIVGRFEDFGGVVAADGFAYWNGTAWATNGAPAVNGIEFLWGLAIDIDDNIYVGGDCDNIGGVTYDNIAMWNGTAWADVGVGLSATVYAMAVSNNGKDIYIGGNFTDAGGVTNADYITVWNGQQYLSLGSGANDVIRQVIIAPNSNVYVSGDFTSIGGLSATAFKVAIWNGATWVLPDIGSCGNIWDVEFANIDPVIADNFDIYLGFTATGAVQIAGAATVNNPGNADAWPTFIITRSGGTSATLKQIRNETTGKTLYLQPSILDGDTITIELSPNGTTVTSAFPGWDNYRYAILPNSDNGTFVLIPGDNLITCFVGTGGAPTITANCLHKAVFTGYDD